MSIARRTNPTLVLIHAFPLDASMWRPQIDRLDGVVRVFAPDLPGFGSQPGLDEQAFTMERMAEYVRRELDVRGIDRCVVCGLSMGGYVAFECVELFGDRIDGMVLADTRATADDVRGRAARFAAAERIGAGDFDGYIDELVPALVSDHTRTHDPDLLERILSIAHRAQPDSVVAALLGMAERIDSTDRLARIGVPVSIIVGEQDRVTGVDVAERMRGAISNSTLTVIPEAGHLSNLESPDAFTDAIRSLLRTIGATD